MEYRKPFLHQKTASHMMQLRQASQSGDFELYLPYPLVAPNIEHNSEYGINKTFELYTQQFCLRYTQVILGIQLVLVFLGR